MNKEIRYIIETLKRTNTGSPWFGKAINTLLEEVDPEKAFLRPNQSEHSLSELLYHMLTWAEFTLHRLNGDRETALSASGKLDWRKIDPSVHTWKKGLAAFKTVNKKIIALLKTKDDSFLGKKVDYREYNFRFLLNGIIQHNIYHAGQLAYVTKLLS